MFVLKTDKLNNCMIIFGKLEYTLCILAKNEYNIMLVFEIIKMSIGGPTGCFDFILPENIVGSR